jgi:hypothetical protein
MNITSQILRCAALACILLVGAGAFGQSSLSPAVQADLLEDQIIESAKAHDYRRMLRLIEERKKLPDIPPAFLYEEAKAAYQVGDRDRALSADSEFLHKVGKTSRQYDAARALLGRIQNEQRAESVIHWVTQFKTSQVRLGTVKTSKGELTVAGFTLACTVHQPQQEHFLPGAILDANGFGFEDGEKYARSTWQLAKIQITIHWLQNGDDVVLKQYHKPPWMGAYYWDHIKWYWTGNDTPGWGQYVLGSGSKRHLELEGMNGSIHWYLDPAPGARNMHRGEDLIGSEARIELSLQPFAAEYRHEVSWKNITSLDDQYARYCRSSRTSSCDQFLMGVTAALHSMPASCRPVAYAAPPHPLDN